MSRHHHPAGNGEVTAAASRPSGLAGVLEAHRRAGRAFRAGGVGSFVREQGSGPAVLCIHGMIGTSFLFRKVLAEAGKVECHPPQSAGGQLGQHLAVQE